MPVPRRYRPGQRKLSAGQLNDQQDQITALSNLQVTGGVLAKEGGTYTLTIPSSPTGFWAMLLGEGEDGEYAWAEQRLKPDGTFENLPGGRSGSLDLTDDFDPLEEANRTPGLPDGTVVWAFGGNAAADGTGRVRHHRKFLAGAGGGSGGGGTTVVDAAGFTTVCEVRDGYGALVGVQHRRPRMDTSVSCRPLDPCCLGTWYCGEVLQANDFSLNCCQPFSHTTVLRVSFTDKTGFLVDDLPDAIYVSKGEPVSVAESIEFAGRGVLGDTGITAPRVEFACEAGTDPTEGEAGNLTAEFLGNGVAGPGPVPAPCTLTAVPLSLGEYTFTKLSQSRCGFVREETATATVGVASWLITDPETGITAPPGSDGGAVFVAADETPPPGWDRGYKSEDEALECCLYALCYYTPTEDKPFEIPKRLYYSLRDTTGVSAGSLTAEYGNRGVLNYNRLFCTPSMDPPPSPPCQAYFDDNMVSNYAPTPFEAGRVYGNQRGEPKYTPQFYASGLSTLQFDPVDGTYWAGRWSVNVEGFFRCTWFTDQGYYVPVMAFEVSGRGYITNNFPFPAGTLVGTTLVGHSTSPHYLGHATPLPSPNAVAFNMSDRAFNSPWPPNSYGEDVPGSDGLAPALPLHLGRFKWESLNLTTLEPMGTLLEADVWVWV